MSWPIPLAQRHHHLVQPEQVELSQAQLPVVDAAQPQEVEDYGQRHDQDAGEEEIVVVDKREAQPGGVCLPDAFLPEIPVEKNVRTGLGCRGVLPGSVPPLPLARGGRAVAWCGNSCSSPTTFP